MQPHTALAFAVVACLLTVAFLIRVPSYARWTLFARLALACFCFLSALILFGRLQKPVVTQIAAAAAVAVASSIYLVGFLLFIQKQLRKIALPWGGGRILLPAYFSEIYRAMDMMTRQRIGALIVIERKEPVVGVIHEGISFHAAVCAEVLLSLFQTASPVHDGAVIISGGQIRRIKVVLPLTTQTVLPMGMGTRHRSAIGATERTDCISLVVSEQRGEMSIAFRGVLLKAASKEELFMLIKRALQGKPFDTLPRSADRAVSAQFQAAAH